MKIFLSIVYVKIIIIIKKKKNKPQNPDKQNPQNTQGKHDRMGHWASKYFCSWKSRKVGDLAKTVQRLVAEVEAESR